MATRPRLRKREIGLAVGAGLIAATVSGGVLSSFLDDDGPVPVAQAADLPAYDGAPFTRLSTVGPQDVRIVSGDRFSVAAEGNPRALAAIEVTVEDGELVIRPHRRIGDGFDWGRLSGASFIVTVPKLEAIAVAGSGSVRLDRAVGDSFSATVAGPGELAIDHVAVGTADFSLAGSGSLRASGTSRDTRIMVAGSGEVEAGGLRSDTASVRIGGSGDAAVNAAREARISIMGSGDVEVTGGASCSVSRMGSGEVSCNGEEVER